MNGRLLAASLAALTVFVGGCVVAPVASHPVEVVRVAPPPPRIEYVGVPPYVGWVWITGYWNWVGVRYVWVPGRWEAPRHGHRWVPHRWERDGDHWRRHGGHWEPDRRSPPRPGPRDDRRGDDDRRHDFRPAPYGAPALGERREPDRRGADGNRREHRESRHADERGHAAPGPQRDYSRPHGEAERRREGETRMDRIAPADEARGRQHSRREGGEGDGRRERGWDGRERDERR
jgi:hypothetical protein